MRRRKAGHTPTAATAVSGTRTAALVALVALGLGGALFVGTGCRSESGGVEDTAVGASTVVVGVPVGAPPAVAAEGASTTPPAVDAYVRFVEQPRAPDSTSAAGDGTSEGLRLLAAAIEALVVRDTTADTTVRPRIEALRVRADSVQRAIEPVQQARITSEALGLASDLLQGLQRPGQVALTDRAAEARTAAAAVRSDVPLVDQTAAVRRFFTRAAAALRGIVGAPTA